MIFASEEHRHEVELRHQQCRAVQRESSRTSSCCDDISRGIRTVPSSTLKPPLTVRRTLRRNSKTSQARRQARQGSAQDTVRTPRQIGVLEEVAVKRRRRQKHVGTTLRKNEGVARGVADGQGSEGKHTRASRWGYSRAATGRGDGNVLSTACTSTERSKRV